MALEVFCHPWVGIFANIPKEDCVTNKILTSVHENGINAILIRPVLTAMGFTAYGLVEFGPEWYGFATVMKFEADYEIDGKGRLDWYSPGDKVSLHCWLARALDFERDGAVARNLNHLYNKKTFENIMDEDRRKNKRIAVARKRDRAQAFNGYYGDDEADNAILPDQKLKLVESGDNPLGTF